MWIAAAQCLTLRKPDAPGVPILAGSRVSLRVALDPLVTPQGWSIGIDSGADIRSEHRRNIRVRVRFQIDDRAESDQHTFIEDYPRSLSQGVSRGYVDRCPDSCFARVRFKVSRLAELVSCSRPRFGDFRIVFRNSAQPEPLIDTS